MELMLRAGRIVFYLNEFLKAARIGGSECVPGALGAGLMARRIGKFQQ